LTTIVAEIIVLVWFQVLYGYLYGRIALLLSTFMLGLFCGSLLLSRLGPVSFRRLIRAQSEFLALLLLLWLAVRTNPPEWVAFLLLFLFGAAGGDLFIVSNRLYLREKIDYGKGYALDLGGSFLGALVTSSVLIPLAGLLHVIEATFFLNLLCLLFLLTRPRNP
jgi:spermidine synthase